MRNRTPLRSRILGVFRNTKPRASVAIAFVFATTVLCRVPQVLADDCSNLASTFRQKDITITVAKTISPGTFVTPTDRKSAIGAEHVLNLPGAQTGSFGGQVKNNE